MKIGVYVQTWHVGGVAAFCERLARGLHAQGHAVSLVIATPHGKRDLSGRAAYERLLQEAAFDVHCLHLGAFHPRERGWRAADYLGAQSFDALFLSSHASVRSALPFLVHRTALLGIAHTDDEDTYTEFAATGKFCRAYVGVSAAITGTLLSGRAGSSPGIIRQIPYGVPAGPPLGAPPIGPPRVLAVSRLVQRQKRVLDLPLLWRKYIELGGEGTLTICGPGEEEGALRLAFAEDLRHGRVRFTGAVPLARMPEVYAEHDILLSVSAYEGLPIVVLEAATAGLLPLLSRTRSGHPEIVQAIGEGKLCGPGDLEAFAKTLKGLSLELARIRGLRPLLRERTQARFGLSAMLEAYAQLAKEATAAEPSSFAGENLELRRPRVDFIRRFIRRRQYERHYGRHPR